MAIRTEGGWVPCCELMSVGGICPTHGRYGDQVAQLLKSEASSDLDLERRALKACGYRVHEKERNGTRWLMAAKGLQVQYKHWHPLTSIHQAMQLLIDLPGDLQLTLGSGGVAYYAGGVYADSAQGLINAQCRTIVTACASLEPVR